MAASTLSKQLLLARLYTGYDCVEVRKKVNLNIRMIVVGCVDNCNYCSSNGTCTTEGCATGYSYVFDDPQRVCAREYWLHALYFIGS